MKNSAAKGILYLIPTPLGEGDPFNTLPFSIKPVINSIHHYIVEDEKSARRFLKQAGIVIPIENLHLYPLNDHTPKNEIPSYLSPLLEGNNMGLMSEAGCPVVADPGAVMVKLAHENDIRVIPLVGPSSILLALMGSGMSGQHYTFHGYLPKEKSDRIRKIKELENESAKKGTTQIFIETPYRNKHVVEDVLSNCLSDTHFCIAAQLTLPDEFVKTMKISEWKKQVPVIEKKPVVFLISRAIV